MASGEENWDREWDSGSIQQRAAKRRAEERSRDSESGNKSHFKRIGKQKLESNNEIMKWAEL